MLGWTRGSTDAEIARHADTPDAAKVSETPLFCIPHWSSAVEFGLRRAGSQDTDLSCHVLISTFCTDHNSPVNVACCAEIQKTAVPGVMSTTDHISEAKKHTG